MLSTHMHAVGTVHTYHSFSLSRRGAESQYIDYTAVIVGVLLLRFDGPSIIIIVDPFRPLCKSK